MIIVFLPKNFCLKVSKSNFFVPKSKFFSFTWKFKSDKSGVVNFNMKIDFFTQKSIFGIKSTILSFFGLNFEISQITEWWFFNNSFLIFLPTNAEIRPFSSKYKKFLFFSTSLISNMTTDNFWYDNFLDKKQIRHFGFKEILVYMTAKLVD